MPAAAPSSVSGLTSEGLVFGTLPYISPEQLRGEKVDTRTDIFAFGALLYEMLTGGRPFTADSQAGLIAAILEHDAPPVSDRVPLAPASLDRIVQKCLAKNPDDRWQTARDLKSELVWVRDGREDARRARAPVVKTGRRRAWRQLIAVGIPTLAALALAVMLWRSSGSAPPRTVTRLSLNLPPGVTLFIPINGTSIAIAPDGSRIAFIGVRAGLPSLFIHQLDTGKTDASSGYAQRRHADVLGGQPVGGIRTGRGHQEGSGRRGPGGSRRPWRRRPDGMAVGWAVRAWQHGRFADPSGRSRRPSPHAGCRGRRRPPHTSADAKRVAPVHIRAGRLPEQVEQHRRLAAGGRSGERARAERDRLPNSLGTDAIVFARGRALFAAGFDSRAIRLTGEPRAMNVQVQTTLYSGAPMYAVANNGTLVYAESPGGRRLVWVDRDGREEFVKADERMYAHLRLSPDGTRVATCVMDADRDLWVIGLDGSSVLKLTAGAASDVMPVWSPDGSEIFFTTAERNINRIPADGSTGPQTIFRQPKPDRLHPLSITPDRKYLLTQWDILPKRIDLRLLELGATPQLKPLIGQSGTERDAQLSRDGKWIVYQSAEIDRRRSRRADHGPPVSQR